MTQTVSDTARRALLATDWTKLDAMTDDEIARQIASNRDAAPDMAPEAPSLLTADHSPITGPRSAG